MGYAKKVAYNTLIQALGRFGTTLVSLVTIAALNSYLGPSLWGEYVAATTFAGFFAVFADLGLNALFLRQLSRYPEQSEKITSEFAAIRIVSAVAILSLAPLSAAVIPTYQPLFIIVALASLAQLFLVLNQLLVSIVQARLLMDRAVLSDFLGRLATLIGTLWGVAFLPEAERLAGALIILTIGNALNLLVTYAFVRSIVPIRFTIDRKSWSKILIQTIPMAALTVLGAIHFKIDMVILTALKGSIDIGIYGNAYKIVEIALVLPGIFVGSLIPALNQAYITKDPNHGSFVQKAFDLLVFAAVPFVAGLILFAGPLMRVLTSAYVSESALALQILSFSLFSWFIGSLFANILLAADRQKILSLLELGAVILNIAINIYAISHFSYLGAAATTVITSTTTVLAVAIVVHKVLQKLPSLTMLWRSVVITIPVSTLIAFVGNTVLTQALTSRVSAALYLGVGGLLFLGLYIGIGVLLSWLPPVLLEKLPWARR